MVTADVASRVAGSSRWRAGRAGAAAPKIARVFLVAASAAVLAGCAAGAEPAAAPAVAPAGPAIAADDPDAAMAGRPVRRDRGADAARSDGDAALPGVRRSGDGAEVGDGDERASQDTDEGDNEYVLDDPEEDTNEHMLDDIGDAPDGTDEGVDGLVETGEGNDTGGTQGIDESEEAGDEVAAVLDGGGDAVGVLDDAAGNNDSGDGGGIDDASDAGVGEASTGGNPEDSGVEVEAPGVRFVVDGLGGVLVEGPCGWLGPLCPLAEDVAPIDAGGPLKYWEPWEDWSTWVGRVLDLCDDHEALVAVNKEWYIDGSDGIDYSAPIPAEAMVYVEEERRRHPVVCSPAQASTPFWKCWGDGSGKSIARLREYLSGFAEPPNPSEVQAWADSAGLDCWDAAAEGARYVYVTADGPLLPQSSVEAAVEDYLERVAWAREQRGGLTTGTAGFPLGAYYAHYAYLLETPADALFVLADSVSVRDGVVRGLAQNHSERLWARNVTVTATDPTGGTGEWPWPLTVQPGEILPFEIENWTGTQNPIEIDFTITADLSPTIDLTRSLDFIWYHLYNNKRVYLSLYNYPEEMGAYPYGTAAFDAMDDSDQVEWIDFIIRPQGSTAHPQLAEAARQQTIEHLTVYAALLSVGGTVAEVWEMTPMNPNPGQFGDGSEEATIRGDWNEWVHGGWFETRTISANAGPDSPISESASVGIVGELDPYIWAGGATPRPRPPDQRTQ